MLLAPGSPGPSLDLALLGVLVRTVGLLLSGPRLGRTGWVGMRGFSHAPRLD